LNLLTIQATGRLRKRGQWSCRTAAGWKQVSTPSACKKRLKDDLPLQCPQSAQLWWQLRPHSCPPWDLRPKAISNTRSLYPSFTEFCSKSRFSFLQQRSLNLVLYTLNPILETYFVPNFYTYVFIIPQMLWTYFIFI
jgi:hypothetical protein